MFDPQGDEDTIIGIIKLGFPNAKNITFVIYDDNTDLQTGGQMTKSTWGGPRPNSGGKRQGAGRKPQTLRITVQEARDLLTLNASVELVQKLAEFVSKHEPKEETK